MKKENIKKILRYRPPIFVSLTLIVLFFALFLYLSVNHKSYAIETENKFSKSITLTTEVAASSEKLTYNNKELPGIIVYKSYGNQYQNYSLNFKGNYGNEYLKNTEITDTGIKYILANSYPNKSLYDKDGENIDSNFQTWITQVSIWLYMYNKELLTNGSVSPESLNYIDEETLYSIKNSKKLINGDKKIETEDTIYNTYIKSLLDNALNKNNDTELKVDYYKEDTIYVTKNNKYYQSSDISIITNNSESFKNYKINIENAPKGTKIVNEEGKTIDNNTTLDVTDKFYIRIPKKTNINKINGIDISIIAIFDNCDSYLYKQNGYKDIIVFNKSDKEIKTAIKINF